MTGHEAKAARKQAGWPLERLAAVSKVPKSAIVYFERTGYMPVSRDADDLDRVSALRQTLQDAEAERANSDGRVQWPTP